MLDNLIADYLKRFKPGHIPLPIFYVFSKLFYTVAADLYVFDKRGYVLLTRRDKNDPFWPNAWHIPGKIVIGSDKNYDAAVKRVVKSELPRIKITKPVLAGSASFYGKRGAVESKIFVAKLIKNAGYEFFNPRSLPKDFIDQFREEIKIAVRKFNS